MLALLLVLLLVAGAALSYLPLAGQSHHWVVRIPDGPDHANTAASDIGLVNHGELGQLVDLFHFALPCPVHGNLSSCIPTLADSERITRLLSAHPYIRWVEQQQLRERPRRDLLSALRAGDPTFSNQWHLYSGTGRDLNVVPVWEKGITGKGIHVCVVDDGIEHTHDDLKSNYNAAISQDFIHNIPDATPDYTDPLSTHGTRCCGQVAAERGDHKCGVGIAYGAQIGGIKILGGGVTDHMEAVSLGFRPDLVDVYSNSWGPNDGNTVEGPAPLAKAALEKGTQVGRRGLGAIYMWAAGNGGTSDDCNCDGYANSIFTIAISAVESDDRSPYYAEQCAAGIAVTYSSGAGPSISTVDWHNGCSNQHGGTSAAAPNAAGVVALLLEANGNKATWRDVQHIIVHGARQVDARDSGWTNNAAGLHVHPRYGFGVMDAAATVDVAANWVNVGPQIVTSLGPFIENTGIPYSGAGATFEAVLAPKDSGIQKLEHVQVKITTTTGVRRGSLEFVLESPLGTRSVILALRRNDNTDEGFNDWTFMTVRCWDERADGVWKLTVRTNSNNGQSSLKAWSLVLYGHSGQAGGLITCGGAEYFDGVACAPCNAECTGCDGPSNLDCTACQHFTHGPACVASCAVLGLWALPNGTCVRCSNQCNSTLGCSSPLARDCVACENVQSGDTCLASCPAFTFISQNSADWSTAGAGISTPLKSPRFCGLCSSQCAAGCTGSSASACAPDSTGRLCAQYNLNGSCVSACPDGGYFADANRVCTVCHASCVPQAGCDGPSNRDCAACRNLALNGACVDECPVGTFADAANENCVSCHTSCESACYGPQNSQCCAVANETLQTCCADEIALSTCTPRCANVRLNNTCLDKCPPTYAPVKGTCYACSTGCAACGGPDPSLCTKCFKFQNIFSKLCVDICPVSTVANSVGQCMPCDSACGARGCFFEGPEGCIQADCQLACPAGSHVSSNCTCAVDVCLTALYNGKCVSECPSQTYSDTDSRQCVTCAPQCDGCTGPTSGDCSACVSVQSGTACVESCDAVREVLVGKVCHPCDTECAGGCYGTGPQECHACRHVQQNGTCLAVCGASFYAEVGPVITLCRACHPDCAGCLGPDDTDCMACNYFTLENRCFRTCPIHTYTDAVHQTCNLCHSECLEGCTGPTASDCNECRNFRFQLECVLDCPITTFHDNDGKCTFCDVACGSTGCYGPTIEFCNEDLAALLTSTVTPNIGAQRQRQTATLVVLLVAVGVLVLVVTAIAVKRCGLCRRNSTRPTIKYFSLAEASVGLGAAGGSTAEKLSMLDALDLDDDEEDVVI